MYNGLLESCGNQIIQSRNQPKTIEQQQDIIDVVESDVPDVVNDKAVDARARGYRMVNGYRVDRPSPIRSNQGANTEIRFSTKDAVPGGFAVIEAGSLQPSHVNGQRNPYFFINEAQPKDRVDDASIKAADDIASAIRPEEITGGVTAYTGRLFKEITVAQRLESCISLMQSKARFTRII